MKNWTKTISAILYFAVFFMFVSCQPKKEKGVGNADELNELIEKNINARGGYEKLKAVKSLKITAKYVQRGRETPVIFTIKRPCFIFAEILYPTSPMICG